MYKWKGQICVCVTCRDKKLLQSSLYSLNVFPQTCKGFLYNSESVLAGEMSGSAVISIFSDTIKQNKEVRAHALH